MQRKRFTPLGKQTSLINTLRFFVLNKEGSADNVANFIKKDYTTALRVIKRLEDRDLIMLKRLDRTGAKGKKKQIYRATLRGLFSYMGFDKNFAFQKFDAIAKAHNDRLLSFKKWDYLKSKGLEDFVRESFFESVSHHSVGEFLFFYMATKITGEPTIPKRRETTNTANTFDADILCILLMVNPPDFIKSIYVSKWGPSKWNNLMKLFKAIEDDYELRMFKDEMVFKMIRKREEQLKAMDKWKEVFAHAVKNL